MVNGVAVQPESRRGVQELRLEECTKREELRCRAERQELMSSTSDTGTGWGQVKDLDASSMQQAGTGCRERQTRLEIKITAEDFSCSRV